MKYHVMALGLVAALCMHCGGDNTPPQDPSSATTPPPPPAVDATDAAAPEAPK